MIENPYVAGGKAANDAVAAVQPAKIENPFFVSAGR
jgi:hypothetical protein